MTEDKFKIIWNKLVNDFNKMVGITEVNRRLIAGITRLLIEKEVLTMAEVEKIEHEVSNDTQ